MFYHHRQTFSHNWAVALWLYNTKNVCYFDFLKVPLNLPRLRNCYN